MANKIFKQLLFWGGVGIVLVTHIMLLREGLPQSLVQQHAMFNLGAGIAIVISRFMK